jgi:hypothetical protein
MCVELSWGTKLLKNNAAKEVAAENSLVAPQM